MIKNENIVCIGLSNWYGNYTKSVVQILERLALHNNVLFVEYPYTIKDIVTTVLGNQTAPVNRMLGTTSRLKMITTNVGSNVFDLIVPPLLPIYFLKNEKIFNVLLRFNVYIYKQTLKRAIKKLKLDNPIVITAFNPFYGLSLLGKLNEKSHIYYCYDAVEASFFGKRIFEFENNFSQKVNAIITTSDYLNKEKLKFNVNSFVVKNGVDFPVFKKYAKKDVYSSQRKKIGYIGSLDPRFDIDIVENAINKLPNFDFEFTGDLRHKAIKSRLNKYSNVSFFDPINPNEVPKLLATYDVGIIPYTINEENKSIYPLKINEYLSVGVPIVMTPFALLPEFDGLVSIAENADDFVTKLIEEVQLDSEIKINKRVKFASLNSWEARTELFSKIIAQNTPGY